MAISLGKITWDLDINGAKALTALKALQDQTKKLENRLGQTSNILGDMGDRLGVFDRDVAKTAKELSKLSTELGKVGKVGRTAAGGLDKAGASLQQGAAQVPTLTTQVGALTAAFAGLAAASGFIASKLLSLAKSSAFLAARVQNLGTVVQNVGQIAGFNAEQINNLETSIKSLGITTRAARQGLAQLAQANIDLSKAAKITRIAQDAAVIAGVDSSEAFNRLVVSIQRNDVRLLRNLGIVINLNSVYRKFSQQTGRTVAQLTAFQKRQLLLNEVIERGALIAGTYEKSLGDVFKQLTSLRRKIEEASLAFGKQFIPILEGATKIVTEFFEKFEAGTAFITPKELALFTAAITIFAAAAAGIAAIGAAFIAVAGIASLSFAPALFAVVGALSAIAAIGGVVALVFIEDKLAALEAAAALEKLKKEARDTAQAYVDVQPTIKAVTAAAKSNSGTLENNAERYQAVRASALELAQAFPKLAGSLEEVVNSTDQATVAAKRLLDVLRQTEPLSLVEDEGRLKVQTELVKDLNKELEESINFILFRKRANEAIAKSEKTQRNIDAKNFKGLQGGAENTAKLEAETTAEKIRLQAELTNIGLIASREAKRFSTLSAESLKTEAGLRDILNEKVSTHIDNQRTLTDVFRDRDTQANAAIQTRIAIERRSVTELKKNLDELSEARSISDQENSRIETQAADRLRGTSAAKVQNALDIQAKLFSIGVESVEDLRALSAKAIASELEDAKRAFDDKSKLDREANEQKIAAIRKEINDEKKSKEDGEAELAALSLKFQSEQTTLLSKFTTERNEISRRGIQKRIDAEENLSLVLERREKVLQNLINLNKDLAKENASEAKAVKDLAAGVLPEIVNLRQRETKETDKLRLASESLQRQRSGVVAELKKELGGADLLKQFGQLEPGEVISDDALVNVSSRARILIRSLAEVNTAIDLTGEKRIALTQKAAERIEDLEEKDLERKRKRAEAEDKRRLSQLERILRDEAKLIRQRIEIGEDGEAKLKLLSKKGIDARIDELELAGAKTEDFIAKTFNGIAASGTKGLGSIISTLSDFEKAILSATTQAQLADLESLFPKAIAANIEEARQSLAKAAEDLRKFDDVGLDKSRAKARGEVLSREKELTAAGVKGRLFQEEIVRLERAQRKEQEADRKKLADKVEEQQKRQRALQDAAKSGEDAIAEAIAERSKLLQPESQQLGELVTLKEESVRLAKEENVQIAESIRLLNEKKQVLLDSFPATEAGEESRAQAESKAAEAEAKRLSDQERLSRLKPPAPEPTPTGKGPPAGSPGSLPGQSDAEAALRGTRSGGDLGPGQFKGPKTPDAPKGPSPAAERALQKIEDDKNKTRLALTPGRFQGPKDPTPPAPTPKQDKAEAALEKLRQEQGLANAAGQAQAEADLAEQSGEAVKETVLATEAIATKNAETARLLEDLAKITKGEAADVAENFNTVTKLLLAQAKEGRAAFKRLPTSKK